MNLPSRLNPTKHRAWPQLRAVLLGFHVLAVVVLSLPGTQMARPARWESRLMKQDLADWSAELRKVGVAMSPEALGQRLQGLARGYVDLRSTLTAPFDFYARLIGMRQSWAMFASPQRHPSEVHVDGLTAQGWQPLYRPHDANADFMGDFLRHNRLRKFQGRFAREMRGEYYQDFADFLGRRALVADPGLSQARVRLFSYASLPPARVRQGARPEGSYSHERVSSREPP
jgi:hypothetical protein